MRKSVMALLLALSMMLSLSACGQREGDLSSSSQPDESTGIVVQPPRDIPFALAAYPSYSFHPVLAENKVNLTLAPLIYEGLFALDDTFTPQNVLCETDTVSEDKLVWTFSLRGGVTFSDGTPLSGAIVAGALNAARGADSRYHARLTGIQSVTAAENVVTITLTTPKGNLPALLDIPIYLGSGDRPLGTGPYVLDEAGESISLAANGTWWQDKGRPAASIPLKTIVGTEDLIAAFDTGDIALLDVDLTGTNALGYSGNYEVWDYNTSQMLYVGFNTQKGLCKQPEMRQALALAIDRETIARELYASHAVASTLPIHPASPLYDKEILAKQLAYDPEGLVTKLESKKAVGKPIRLLVNSENSARVAAAQQIAYQLEGAGMVVTVDKLTWENYVAALAAGDFDLYLGEVRLTADFDLSSLLSYGGALNYGGWQDETTQALLAAFAGAGDTDRAAAATQLYTHLCQQVPIAPICFKNGSALTQWGRLKGLSPVQNNVFFNITEWDIIS